MLFSSSIIKYILISATLLLLMSYWSCSERKDDFDTEKKTKVLDLEIEKPITVKSDTIVYIRYGCCFIVSYQIKYPDGNPKGTILVLHALNATAQDFCMITDFCQAALKGNYVLIMPNFGGTIYPQKTYDHATFHAKRFPSYEWVRDLFIPEIQYGYELLLEGQKNYIIGLSVGSRGAIKLGSDLPHVFSGIAVLSGYFNIYNNSTDSLYISALGNLKDYPELWQTENLLELAEDFQVPIYIGHGQADRVTSAENSYRLSQAFTENKDLEIITSFPLNEPHGYLYWEKEFHNIFYFFENVKSNNKGLIKAKH